MTLYGVIDLKNKKMMYITDVKALADSAKNSGECIVLSTDEIHLSSAARSEISMAYDADCVEESVCTALREKGKLLTEIYARELLASAPEGGRMGRVILTCQPDLDSKEAKLLLGKLIEAPGTAAVILYPVAGKDGEEGRICYLLGKAQDSPADCKYLCEMLNGLYNGKGGGKAGFAQGSGKLRGDWQETAEGLRRML